MRLLAALGVVSAQCTGGAPAATQAAAALVPGWQADAHLLTAVGLSRPFGDGSTPCTFRVTDARAGAEPAEVSVRLLLPGSGDFLASTARVLAANRLTPEVFGSNTAALVQRWLPGGPLVASDAAQETTAAELGRLVGRLHALPPPVHGGSNGTGPYAVVWTHGDLHARNILHGPSHTLVVVDLEAVGARPAVSDLAYLFFTLRCYMHLEGRSLEDAESFPLATRAAFLEAYFPEAGVPGQELDADAWLWAIEEDQPAVLRYFAEKAPLQSSLKQFAAQLLPHVVEAIQRQVAFRDRGEKTQLIEQGAVALALREAGPTLRSEIRHGADEMSLAMAKSRNVLLLRRGLRLA